MFRNLLTVALIVMTLLPPLPSDVSATPLANKETLPPAEAKSTISRIPTGPKARIEVKLRDGKKLKGFLAETGDNKFVVVNKKTGVATTVAYTEVSQVQGHALSKRTGALIAVAIVVVAVIVTAVMLPE